MPTLQKYHRAFGRDWTRRRKAIIAAPRFA
jgi:hypothetical protein